MFIVYILESIHRGRWYIGHTSNIKERLMMHNDGNVRSSAPYAPYRLIYQEKYDTKAEAFRREMQIKRSGIIRKAIKNRVKLHGPIV